VSQEGWGRGLVLIGESQMIFLSMLYKWEIAVFSVGANGFDEGVRINVLPASR